MSAGAATFASSGASGSRASGFFQRPALRFALIAGLALLAAHLLDAWAQVTIVDRDIYEGDFGRLLRVQGYYPLWIMASLALLLTDWPRLQEGWSRKDCARRAGMMFLAPALAGGFGELGKISFRRLRPGEIPGEYMFRAWAERPFYSGGLGFPSSHAVVAFGAAAILARLFPRAAPVWYLLAAGCGLSRVAAGAHYLSDVAAAAILGWAAAWMIWRWMGPVPPLEAGRQTTPATRETVAAS